MQGPTTPESKLLRVLGTWGLAASIVNVTIGGGIFRLPAPVAASLGTAAPIAYIVCSVAMGLIVLSMAQAASRVSLTGGPYAYVEVAFGRFVGFQAGIQLWLLGTLAQAAVSTIFADSFVSLFPNLDGPYARAAVLISIFLVLAVVNIMGVRQGAGLNVVLTCAKLLPLLLLIVAGIFSFSMENVRWVATPSSETIARTSVLLIFAYSGIECALVPSGEVVNPTRTIPRAILIAMGAVTVLYLVIHLVTQSALGNLLAESPTPLADAASVLIGPWGRTLLLVGAVISMGGYVSGITLAVPRALFAFGRDGFLPKVLASVHTKYRTPHVAIIVQSTLVCTLAISSAFEQLAILANLATLLLYGACCLASWQLHRRNVRADGIPFRIPASGLASVVAILIIGWILTSITMEEWAVVGAVALVSSVIFFVVERRRKVRA